MATFYERFQDRSEEIQSLLCVGLDPDIGKLPAGYEHDYKGVAQFLSDIVRATAPYTVAYKPNLAFFEVLGSKGWQVFEKLISVIRAKAPGALIIADAKRGDIENTAGFYAKTFFETYDCDAMTVNPYMGLDTLEPYLSYTDKGVIVLGLTSNPGARFFQMKSTPPLYELVARTAYELNTHYKNVWLVVGATQEPEHLAKIREMAVDVPFLVPGIGAQGGDLHAMLSLSGINQLINASRSILYSSKNRETLMEAAARNAYTIVETIQEGILLMRQGG